MQPEREPFTGVAKACLAGFLAFLLLLSTAIALSSTHEESHLSDGKSGGDSCVYCLLAHGKVLPPDVTPASVAAVHVFVAPAAAIAVVVPSADDHRLLPSRAPPA